MLIRRSGIGIACLFLLAMGSSGPATGQQTMGTVVLPTISEAMAKFVDTATMSVAIVELTSNPGSARPQTIRAQQAQWKSPDKSGANRGMWLDSQGRNVSELIFPLASLKDPQNPKLQYQVNYRFMIIEHKMTREQKVEAFIPIRNGTSFSVSAPLPLELMVVDVGQLQFVAPGSTAGLTHATWQVAHGRKSFTSGDAAQRGTINTHILVEKADPVTAKIEFHCVDRSKIPWDGNGKDLRARGLTIVLHSPCPK